MIYLVVFIVLTLAVARATRVIVIDDVAIPLREWVLRRFGPSGRMAKLIRCYWCSAFWVSFFASWWVHCIAVFADWLPATSLCLWPVTAFAVAYAASWVLDKENADGI